jgi:FMN phosphatase YigB (HAD superfamily)
MADVVSFDVFDTCITRTYHKPADLFLELARLTLSGREDSADASAIETLAKQRSVAETNARKSSPKEDIQIADIYRELEKAVSMPLNLSAMLSLELDLELASMVPIRSTLDYYRELCSTGQRIIFISDMYLPKSTIMAMLSKCGYDTRSGELYLSGDVGLQKRTGSLFAHVLKAESIPPFALTHHGDNQFSDVKIAKKIGIDSVHIPAPELSSPYEEILLHENGVWPKLSNKLQMASRHYRKFYRAPVCHFTPEKQIALSRVAAASRILLRNKSDLDKNNNQLKAIGYFVAAPLFTSFVLWLLDSAEKNGIKRLYFVARNGQIFHQLAEKICISRGIDIECRYIYGSRAAWYPASFKSFDSEFIDLLVEKYPFMTIRQIFEDLSLPKAKVDTLMYALKDSALDAENCVDMNNVKRLLVLISESENCHLISEHFEYCRRGIFRYLSQEQVLDQSKIGFVDIGWHLSSHNALHRIIHKFDGKGFTGFYFGVGKKRQDVADDAPYYAFLSDESSKENSWLFKHSVVAILEEVFAAADHPTTSGYYLQDDQVSPRFNLDSQTENSLIVREVQDAIHEFVDFVLERKTLHDLSLVAPEALNQLERMYRYPTAEEARALAETPVFTMTSHLASQQRELARKVGTAELVTIILNILFKGRNISLPWLWLQGSMAMSNGFVASIGKLLFFLESLSPGLKKRNHWR